jgi:Double zinc ribbon
MCCSKCRGTSQPANDSAVICGAALQVACPKCGSENPPESRYCGDCGTALIGAEPVITSAASSSPSDRSASQQIISVTAEGERKTLTALFAGSTELIEHLDPEEAGAIIDPALHAMIAAVRAHDGHVVQSTGDGSLPYLALLSQSKIIHKRPCSRRWRCNRHLEHTPDSNHEIPIEQPRELANLLESFIAGLG